MQPPARWRPCAAALSLAALAVACYDAPVQYSLEIRFRADATVELEASTILQEEWLETRNPKIQERIDAIRDSILHDEDLWSQAFRNAHPPRERLIHDSRDGLLVGAIRLAWADDPSWIETFFEKTPVKAYVSREGRTITLELVPAIANDTTERQERLVSEALDEFSRAVARHMKALAALYSWLEDHPDQARPAMASLIGVEDAGSQGLPQDVRKMIERIDDTAEDLMDILTVEKDRAYTLNELSRMVHDPFPVPVTIEVEGEILDVRGFLADGENENRVSTRTHGLWEALVSLHDRWVRPVPAVESVAALRQAGNEDAIDEEALLEDILSRPRVIGDLPDAAEVRRSLESELIPPDTYRLQWTLPRE